MSKSQKFDGSLSYLITHYCEPLNLMNMKRIILLTLLVIAGSMIIWSQVPQAMNYKAVAKDDWGVALPNKTITLRFTILQGSETGSIVYQETHTTVTNKFGLMDVEIGKGTPVFGSFDMIDWGTGVYYIKIEMDSNGGTNFRLEDPPHQLLSVPYAFFAESSGNTNFTETDPYFISSPSSGIWSSDIFNWNTAFSWGNHADEGYLKSFAESDPVFLLHPAYGITSDNISNWNAAFVWGDHTGLYKPLNWMPAWGEITENPFLITSPLANQLLKYNAVTERWENWIPDYLTAEIDGSTTNEIQNLSQVLNTGNNGGGINVKNIADPVEAQDAATKSYVDALKSRLSTLENQVAALIASGNEPVSQKRILITEIMANQAGTEEGGAGEFIELINAGTNTVDLHNLWIAVGTQDAFYYDQLQSFQAGITLLLPGAYAVILDPNYDNRYSFPKGTVLVTVGDADIGSRGIATNSWITLYDVNRSTILDEFQCGSDPGDGISLYRISLNAENNSANWAASPSGSTPGKSYSADACFVTTFTSFWADRLVINEGRFWKQAIGYPDWSGGLVSVTFEYRYNVPAPNAFEFKNPYSDYDIVFKERNSPTAVGNGSEAYVRVDPGVTILIPASSLGYYYVYTEGPEINTLESADWSDPYTWGFSFPQDGIIAPFFIEIQ
jgi:hypothetical protein